MCIRDRYNGWTNYATWNVALHIQNNEELYIIARDLDTYAEFRSWLISDKTSDGISWDNKSLDIEALDDMIKELT